MRSGQYIAAYAPYGYRKSEEDRHRLVIDEEAAAVVRRMFELRRRAGMAYGKDRRCAEQRGHPVPTLVLGKAVRKRLLQVREPLMYATVKNVLTNEVYTGNLIQNQTGSRSYKDDTMIYKPESERIRHEAFA